MKFMATWKLLPGTVPAAVDHFIAGGGDPVDGMKLLGRWHSVDCSGGFTLVESNDPIAIYKSAVGWANLIELKVVPVIEDPEAGPLLMGAFKK